MPVVPQVDVDRACEACEQEQEVDTEAYWDDECAHGGVVCHGCGSRPSHVEDIELQVVDIHYLSERRSETGCQQTCDDSESDEADTYVESALQGF